MHKVLSLRSVAGVAVCLALVFIVSGCAIVASNNLNSFELSEYGSELIFAYLHQPSGLEGIVNRWGEPTMILTEPLGGDSVEFMIGDQEWSFGYGWNEDGTAVIVDGGPDIDDVRKVNPSGRELLSRVEYGNTTIDELSRMLEKLPDCEWEPFLLLTPERVKTESVYQWNLHDGSGFSISLGADLGSKSRGDLDTDLFGVYYWGPENQEDPGKSLPSGF